MDSDDTLTSQSQFSSSVQLQLLEDVSLEDIMNCEGQNHQQVLKYSSSRLSSCSSFSNGGQGQVVDQGNSNADYCDHGGYTSMCSLHSMSRLSIESFDGGADADEELSDKEKRPFSIGFSSESDDGEVICYSLPATPPRKKPIVPSTHRKLMMAKKDYGSETDAQKSILDKGPKMNRYVKRTKGRSKSSRKNSTVEDSVAHMSLSANNSSYGLSGGESEGSGLMVITKPKGGTRSICMDIDEVKACRELGFELEHERMLEMPSRLSVSVSNLDTSSGGNSPISSWRISSPGDNPKEVKARLKVWAQAVAIVSSTAKPANLSA
ncbi:unnamed protein product [Rhodiola kirilowii]